MNYYERGDYCMVYNCLTGRWTRARVIKDHVITMRGQTLRTVAVILKGGNFKQMIPEFVRPAKKPAKKKP